MESLPADAETSPGSCPLNAFLFVAGGKYKMRILWELKNKPLRYGELRRSRIVAAFGTPVTARVLSRELRELQARGVVHRRQRAGSTVMVEYGLTPLGESLIPVLEQIVHWGLISRARIGAQPSDRPRI